MYVFSNWEVLQIAKFMGPTWGPPASCRPQVGPMWAPWTLLSGRVCVSVTLRWRQNGRDSVSNHQPGHCLLSLLYGGRSKKTSKLRFTGLCVGNSPGPVNSPHKGPVTRKMFPFDDVIMIQIQHIPNRCWELCCVLFHCSDCTRFRCIYVIFWEIFFMVTEWN